MDGLEQPAEGATRHEVTRDATPSPFVPEDVLAFKVVSDLDLSKDGRWLVYSVEEADPQTDAYICQLWLIETQGGAPKQLTFGTFTNRYARFSPDGSRIAFLSNRSGGASQLYVLSLSGGEAWPVTHLKAGAGEPVWSPDGESIAFVAPLAPTLAPDAPKVIRKAYYKVDGVGYLLDQPTHLFRVPASGGDAVQLTHGEASVSQAAWSPDGRRLAFTKKRAGAREAHRSDLWILNAAGDEEQLTDRCAQVQWPSWSPDGQRIAFYGSAAEGQSREQLWVIDSTSQASREARALTSEDEEIANFPLGRTAPPLWNTTGTELLVATVEVTRSAVSSVPLTGGETRRLLESDRQITMVAGSASAGRLAFLWSDPNLCGHLSISDWKGEEERELVNVNQAWAERRTWPKATLRDFAGKDAPTNHGLLMVPEGKGPWPLLVDVHGGPHSYVELGFPYHPYWYVLVSRGWAVLSLNPVGSASFGHEFAERLRGRWGELDLPEQLAAVDALVAEGVVDGSRVAIAGKSYGGYMAAWAIGKTDRFRAAVCSAPVTNLESHFGTSDSGHYVDPYDMHAEPWEDRERYHRLSPIRCASEAVTPTLILQGEDDRRCPLGQAEELFAHLIRSGKAEVELVVYPGGSHRLAERGRPSHRVDYSTRLTEFVTRHAGA